MKGLRENLSYTWKHKVAFLKVERTLLGRISIRGVLHDVDKLFLYLVLDKKTTHKIHRKFSRHHELKARTDKDFTQMIIDWECARITKPDKPLNAYQTLLKFYPHLSERVLPIIMKLNLTDQ